MLVEFICKSKENCSRLQWFWWLRWCKPWADVELQGSGGGLNESKWRTACPVCHAAAPGASPVSICWPLAEPVRGASPCLCHPAGSLLMRSRVAVEVQGFCWL